MATLITFGQRDQIKRLAADAAGKVLDRMALDSEAAQRVIHRGDEFAAAMREAAEQQLRELSVHGQFAREEVVSTYDYPPEYTGPVPLDAQAGILRAAFPGLGDYDHAFASSLGQVEGTEGLFLVPRVEKLAPSYGGAVERMFGLLAASRTFTNYREGEFGERYLRQHERSVAMVKRACELQQGDLLVLPGQFGKLHAGRSMRRSRELFHPTEWGGGAFAAACMILTHPTRFVRWEQLHVFCPGDEFAPVAGGQFVDAPCFLWYDGRLEFFADGLSGFNPRYGSVSFRLPE